MTLLNWLRRRLSQVLLRRGCPRRFALALAFPAMPPHGELTPPAPYDGDVDREHEKSERDHPESEHGQKAEQAAGHEHDTEADADRLRLRQMPVAVEKADLVSHARA